MHAWESIQNTIDYIEENIEELFHIDELANKAGLSQFYYQRLFHRLVHKPVMEYIRLRKLVRASELLKETNNKIIEVAFQCGFENHETFSRVFKETYGLTPKEYQKQPVILNHFPKPDLLLNYVMVDEHVPLISDGMVLEVFHTKLSKPRYFLGIEKELSIEELLGKNTGVATAAKLWEEVHEKKPQIKNVIEGNELGALYIGDAKPGFCKYMAGVEVSLIENTEGFSTFVVPEANYLVCGFEAESESELYGTAVFKADQFMKRWIESHNLSMSDFGIEMYYHNCDVHYLEHWGKEKEVM